MKNLNKENLLYSFISLVLGVLLIFFKSNVIQIAITAFGVYVLVIGIIEICKNKQSTMAIVKIIIGAILILLAWIIKEFTFIVLGVALLSYGIFQIYKHFTSDTKLVGFIPNLKALISPIIYALAGICCFFTKAIDSMFIVLGIIIALNGLIGIILAFDNNSSRK